jgi:hypothetical protein
MGFAKDMLLLDLDDVHGVNLGTKDGSFVSWMRVRMRVTRKHAFLTAGWEQIDGAKGDGIV